MAVPLTLPLNTVGFSVSRCVLLPRPPQGQVVPSLFPSDKRSHCCPSQIKGGGVLACASQVLWLLQYVMSQQEHVKAHTSLSPPAECRGKSPESVDECATDVSIIPPVLERRVITSFSPAAKIAFGTGMQYGPQQSVLVSTCQRVKTTYFCLSFFLF